MNRFESITIREVESSDLEAFYAYQLDPEAIRMAAFVGKDPKDKVAFDGHLDKILHSSQITQRTIVAEGQVAGHIASYPDRERMEVTYWIGREFWGRGLATQALNRMLQLVVERPLFARAATDNIGSLECCRNAVLKSSEKTKISPTAARFRSSADLVARALSLTLDPENCAPVNIVNCLLPKLTFVLAIALATFTTLWCNEYVTVSNGISPDSNSLLRPI
ncbi:MAG: GNAT family N-acetyltransferase [Chthoniobacterales bacterium]